MNNVTLILNLLDEKLNSKVELTLYGRAALQLGFEKPLEEHALTKDVDAVFQIGQAEMLLAQTNFWEADYAANSNHVEDRPLNLDPGYISQAKLVLATTKDRDHRIYLRDGMFAEVTLTYVGKSWQHHRWSYPSYRTKDVAEFASECRQRLREHLRATRQFREGTHTS